MSNIENNLKDVNDRIKKACEKSNRDLSDVTLIAVSKTKPIEDVLEANKHGLNIFGENKVQEIVAKYDFLPGKEHWHMIGHLQTNKVKYIIDKVDMIHSVDSIKLANEINKQAIKHNVTMDILLEVNIGMEDTKFGISKDEVFNLANEISTLSNVRLRGLMCVAPFVANPEDNRLLFRELKNILIDINSKKIDNINMNVLSMGMTNDFEIAIEEGATHIRVGTALFGERNYNI